MIQPSRNSISSFILLLPFLSIFFFFNDTATTEIYTLSLHDALPISEAGERMARNVEPEDLLLEGEALVRLPLRHHLGHRRARRGRSGRQEVEERRLALCAVALLALAALERGIRGREQMRPRQPERVEGARLAQGLEHAAVHEAEVHTGAEVLERREEIGRAHV